MAAETPISNPRDSAIHQRAYGTSLRLGPIQLSQASSSTPNTLLTP